MFIGIFVASLSFVGNQNQNLTRSNSNGDRVEERKIMFDLYSLVLTIFVGLIFNELVTITAQEIRRDGRLSINVPQSRTLLPNMFLNGTAFGNSILNVGPTQIREDLIWSQFASGNMPDFMRNAIPITAMAGNDTLIYWVLPDVLCVGNNADYLRTPINPLTAQKIADLYGCILPTRKMAQQIWQTATVKLTPSPNGPPYDATMLSTDRMIFHNNKIQVALGNRSPGELVTGHKKDVVISTGLLAYPKNVAIVGWWYPSGQMIQPLNYVSHDRYYKDYSHGIRLINRLGTLNGRWCDLYDILRNQTLANLISDEGPFDATYMYK